MLRANHFRAAFLGLAMVSGLVTASAQEPAVRAKESGEAAKTDSEIRDEARVFSREARTKAETELGAVEAKRHVPVLIATVDSLEGRELDEEALRIARQWGKPGILVFIPRREMKIEVRVYRSIEPLVPPPARRAIKDAFIQHFREKDFDGGLLAGINVIDEVLARATADGKTVAASEPAAGTPLVARDQVRLTLAGARRALAAAEAKAAEMGVRMNIAVVDDGGHLIAFSRMDGARPASVATAITKATTAATLRQPTGPLLKDGAPDVLLNLSLQNAAEASGGKITTLYGGVPFVVDGQVVGAVGVGGGRGEQDAEVAKAGVAAVVDSLKATPR